MDHRAGGEQDSSVSLAPTPGVLYQHACARLFISSHRHVCCKASVHQALSTRDTAENKTGASPTLVGRAAVGRQLPSSKGKSVKDGIGQAVVRTGMEVERGRGMNKWVCNIQEGLGTAPLGNDTGAKSCGRRGALGEV